MGIWQVSWQSMNHASSLYFKPLLFTFLTFIKWTTTTGNNLMQITPCVYPIYVERHACGVQDSHLLNGLFCDPDSTVSMSEMQLVDDVLQNQYKKHQSKCVCRKNKNSEPQKDPEISDQCWYKFGFAFLKELYPLEGRLSDAHSSTYCPINDTSSTSKIQSPAAVHEYGVNYARVVRERWNYGSCDEDILFMIVQRRPRPLASNNLDSFHPYIFVSYGQTIVDKLADIMDPYTLVVNDPLKKIVEEENRHLSKGYPLNRVLINLIIKMSDLFSKLENYQHMPLHKDHVPFWAWMVFLSCGLLCVFMGIGLSWIRITTRRGSQRAKQIHDPGRRWKAGFLGGLWYDL